MTSQREDRIAFHRLHVSYHRKAVADHASRSETVAEEWHHAAAHAHEPLTDGRADLEQEGLALRLSAMADHASYEAKKARDA